KVSEAAHSRPRARTNCDPTIGIFRSAIFRPQSGSLACNAVTLRSVRPPILIRFRPLVGTDANRGHDGCTSHPQKPLDGPNWSNDEHCTSDVADHLADYPNVLFKLLRIAIVPFGLWHSTQNQAMPAQGRAVPLSHSL